MSDNIVSAVRRAIVATNEPAGRRDLQEILEGLDFAVTGCVANAERALETARQESPDVVILGIGTPYERDLAAARILHDERLAPVVLVASPVDRELIRQARQAGVVACLAAPLSAASLRANIEVAIGRWQKLLALERQVADLDRRLQTRSTVERARGILMSQLGLKEQEAYRRMQTLSMNTRRPMRLIAEQIISANEVQRLQPRSSPGFR